MRVQERSRSYFFILYQSVMKISIAVSAILILMGLSGVIKGELTPTSIGLIVMGLVSGVFSYMKNLKDAKYRIDADSARNMVKSEEAVLVDVRESNEYESGHIPGSVSVPLSVFDGKIEKTVKDKNKTVIVYCQSGGRSAMALRALVGKGYTSVYDLGGINSWPYEIEP